MNSNELTDLDPCWPEEFEQRMNTFYSGKKVLVLGADGFLGSNCVIFLKKLGAEISVVSRQNESRVKNLANNIFYGDLSSPEFTSEVIEGQDIIFDFMGSTGAVESNNETYTNFKRECQPHLNLFSACAEQNSKAIIVFCSSRLVYGKPQFLPVSEEHPLAPESLYAVHKVTLENYLRVFAKTSGIQSCILRLSNPYGPNMETRKNTYSILNIFIRQALQKKSIQIYGDGHQYRDYIHIRDVINAFLGCPTESSCVGETFNLSGKHKIKLKDAAQLITETAEAPPLEFVTWPEEYKVVETGDYFATTQKLHSSITLPEHFSFHDALKETVSGYLNKKLKKHQELENEYN